MQKPGGATPESDHAGVAGRRSGPLACGRHPALLDQLSLPSSSWLARISGMRYVMSNKWSLTEHFVITDDSGNPRFDVRGNLGLTQRLTFRDESGQEVAEIRKHLMTTTHDILIGG